MVEGEFLFRAVRKIFPLPKLRFGNTFHNELRKFYTSIGSGLILYEISNNFFNTKKHLVLGVI